MVQSVFRTSLLACLLLAAQTAPVAGQGNVLLVIADDLGIDSLTGFNATSGVSLPPTPTLDRLRAEGISFERFYAYPTCSPSRAAILTGRHAFRTGVTSPSNNQLSLNEFTLPEALVASGVIGDRLACIGKWHLGEDANSPNAVGGWPHFSGSLGGALSDYTLWTKVVDGTSQTSTTYATTDNVNDAVAWIQSQDTQSWFLWLAFNAPHTPLHRPPLELHDYDTISESTDNSSRQHYEAMVQAMDTEIGRLLESVDLQETTVIFLGDNGTPRSVVQSPFSRTHAKDSIYEGGVRVPLIVAGAGVDTSLRGSVNANLLHACDLYSTILELFGVVPSQVYPTELVLDSRSFLTALQTGSYSRNPSEIFCLREDPDNSGFIDRAIIGETFKYVLFADGSDAFFKVDDNPRELNNLLDGDLTLLQRSILEDLQPRIGDYVNIPMINNFAVAADYSILTLGWYADAELHLEYSPNLQDWSLRTDAEILEGDSASISIRFPSPTAGAWFYRVVESSSP